ncbi:Alpha/Beta hydrolase protein [Mrakia frigida]|uniref:Alpha/Beta hydrolase protein n=1 Tax=Mrakia frigida TaxID=29902 RepID=UPI003FCC0A4C
MVLLPSSKDSGFEMVAEQLVSSERVSTQTRFGKVTGARANNGAQVFLNIPYAEDVPRWTDAKPLPEDYKYDESYEFVKDAKYPAQSRRSYNMQPNLIQVHGLGSPTDSPFFVDIHVPSKYKFGSAGQPLLPVGVFYFGGTLQYGSTSGQHYSQQQHMAEFYGEIRVLIGYRVGVMGFLSTAATEPEPVKGNFAFKDCWLGLEWVRDNIHSFGGDASRIDISGLSAGAHVCHQMLLHAARLAPAPAPFKTAFLQSNAILTNPPIPNATHTAQFKLLCSRVGLDPESPTALADLRDPSKISTEKIMFAIEGMDEYSYFRGIQDMDGFVQEVEEYQQGPQFAEDLRTVGVECVVLGGVRDENKFYRITHSPRTKAELVQDVERYYLPEAAARLVDTYLPEKEATPEELTELVGHILGDCQVHMPVRFLARDLLKRGFPVVRYEVQYLAKFWDDIAKDSIAHGTDLVLLHLRLTRLTPLDTCVAQKFLLAIEEEMIKAQSGDLKPWNKMLVLKGDGTVVWEEDERWAGKQLQGAEFAVRGSVQQQ